MMKVFVDYEWLMEAYDDSVLPEEIRDYGVPMAVIRQNIADAPYVRLRDDEITTFEKTQGNGIGSTYQCQKCRERIYGAKDYGWCPFCGRKILRVDE